jgi:DNA-binding transcriptional LysR family regulator
MINLRDLQVFVTANECGSFSEAGRKLNLSQSAVSQVIGGLEKQFGISLFLRSGRSLRLTEAGQALLPMALELLAASFRLEENMHNLQDDVVGQMAIGCSTASGKYLLPGLVARFRQQHPRLRVDVLVSSRKSVIRQLLSGDVALAVTSKLVEARELEYQDFYTDEIILVAPADHPWAKFRQVYPDDLLDVPLILREEGAGTTEVLLDGLRQHGITEDMLNIAMVLGNAEAISMAVEEGIGVAFISRLSARRGLEVGNLVEIAVTHMCLTRKLFMARNTAIPATRAQTAFWDFVKTQMPALIGQLIALNP